MADCDMTMTDQRATNGPENWRMRPLARAMVSMSCGVMLMAPGAPLYAAPAINALPQAAANWVQAGSATNTTTGNTMTINQGSSKVILNWQSFNIGSNAAVQFNQPSAAAAALNKIGGNSASEIFGRLSANGNIYLINNNGILFGANSQTNVHGLVVSTLNVDDNRFLNSSITQAINDRQAALEGGTVANASIVIDAGAGIKTDSGGQILIFAPNVENRGDIATPDGQTILAASHDKVYLATSDKDQDLRGLLVEVDTGGNVTNVGKIVAERGNVTLLGLAVNQQGRITATTSVDVNGSIRLLARDRAQTLSVNNIGSTPGSRDALLLDDDTEIPTANTEVPIAQRGGTVTLGQGSTTEVIADNNGRLAADAQTQYSSRIDIVGKSVAVLDNATVSAKAGRINITATTTPANPQQTIERTDSRIYLGKNATLDVSGENIELPMERRIVEVELRGDELKDSPLQRNGILRGQTVRVDIDHGSPLIADIKPTLAKIQKGVKERSVDAGTINLQAQGDVVFADNATLNTTGGSIKYAAGNINTTKLLSATGRIVDIGDADPLQLYVGILGEHDAAHPKWGKLVFGSNSIFSVGEFRDGFVEGADAGTLNITTEALYGFDLATLKAAAIHGVTQRDTSSAPSAGVINILLSQGTQGTSGQSVLLDALTHSASLAAAAVITAPGAAYPQAIISAEKLNASGAGAIRLTTNGHIDVADNADLQLSPGASLSLTGTSLSFDGRVRAAAGAVNLATKAPINTVATGETQPLMVGEHAHIDVSGTWTNDLVDRTSVLPIANDGGKISIAARGDIAIAQGAQLYANAGAHLSATAVFNGGNGGSIRIATNARSQENAGSRLALLGAMQAYGFSKGGTLSLQANGFHIGGVAGSDDRIVQIDPTLFARGGFENYVLTANLLGIDVQADAVLNLRHDNYVATDMARLSRIGSGADISPLLSVLTLPDYDRSATNLQMKARQTVNLSPSALPAYLRVGTHARIDADAGANIALESEGNLFVDGAITAKGGDIALRVVQPDIRNGSQDRLYFAGQSLWLGGNAHIDASSTSERSTLPAGQAVDRVFDAGTVELTAQRGYVVAAPGVAVDVSAQSYVIQNPQYLAGKTLNRTSTTMVNAAAGSITFAAADGMAIYADLAGSAVGDGRSGSVAFTLDGNARQEDASTFPYFDLDMQVYNVLPTWNATWAPGANIPIALRGKALFGIDAFRSGGFGALALTANNKTNTAQSQLGNFATISFADDIQLNLADALMLAATNVDVRNHRVNLSAATLSLGNDLSQAAGHESDVAQKKATTTGTGTLVLAGKTVEVIGNVGISGASNVAITSAGDLRLRAVLDGRTHLRTLAAAEFTTPANLTLQAAQIYPTTLSDYTLKLTGANATLTTIANGARTPLLSAGGKLHVQAANIEHGGVLAAPLGTIDLKASNRVHLAAGSVIDVSAHNLLIPFGRLRGGDLNWIYPILSGEPLIIDNPPEKSVRIDAPNVAIDAGSLIDLSGGGDIYAFEQVPGPGGSKDFLDLANANGAFAVVPWLGSLTTPYDAVEMTGLSLPLGSTVYLAGGGGLPAGNYAILPAHYALLQGAYLITPQGNAVAGGYTASTLSDGTATISGRFGRGLSGQFDTQWQTFAVETGAAARLRSEYTERTGGQFFGDDKTSLAADAGALTISAQTVLSLNGAINAAAQNGRRGLLDIVADKIAVVSDATQPAENGAIVLLASALNALGVDSILLGGKRTRVGDDTRINVASESVTIKSGAELRAPDIVLAARDSINVEANAKITAEGNSTTSTRAFVINGDGSLLRVSNAAQANVQRTSSNGSAGDLNLAAGATLTSNQSILIDATHNLSLPGTIAVADGSLNLSANRINLGAVPNGTAGVNFSAAELNAMGARELILSSRSAIDFFGNVDFSNAQTTLNTGALRSMVAGDVRIGASATLQLANGVNATAPVVGATGGNLILDATTIVLGRDSDAASTLALTGFDNVQLGTAGRTAAIVGDGQFELRTGALTAYADRITANSAGAKTALNANGAVVLNRAAAPIPATDTQSPTALGATLNITGTNIIAGTTIELASGTVALNANGSATGDGVHLLDNSRIDVGGRSLALTGATMATKGGKVALTAAHGDVQTDAGAQIVLTGAAGVDAGALDVSAIEGRVSLGGAIAAQANGVAGGRLSVDANRLDNADALLAAAMNAGISEKIALRARSGDIQIAQNVTAHTIDIAADGGALRVGANLNASGTVANASGGSVALYARDDVALQANAVIDARATSADARGGRVEIGTRTGVLSFTDGSRIDVSGGVAARNGSVLLRAPRIGGSDAATRTDVAITNAGVTIAGAERVQVAAFENYAGADVGALLGTAFGDAAQFMSHEADITARLGSLGSTENFALAPEIEITNSGPITISSALDFAADADFDGVLDWRFGSKNTAPILSIRSAGDLTIGQSISDGTYVDTLSTFALYFVGQTLWLQDGESASYRLVAGADLGAANPNATTSTGDLIIADGADIVTGTGNIQLAAGRNIEVTAASTVIAALGNTTYAQYDSPFADDGLPAQEFLPDSGTFNAFFAFFAGNNAVAEYPKQGGAIDIDAKGSITFAEATGFFSDWLTRVGGTFTIDTGASVDPVRAFNLTTWGVAVERIQEGLVALGGGNINVNAGADITHLNAALPTTGKQVGVGSNQVEITGGGDLFVRAGGDILSARVLADKGTALLQAGGDIGAATGGLNTLAVLGDAALRLDAVGNIGIDSVTNTTVIPLSANQNARGLATENYFFTYGNNAQVSAQTLTGDITLAPTSLAQLIDHIDGNFGSHEAPPYVYGEGLGQEQRAFRILPGRLSLQAASGSVDIQENIYLFPSRTGNLSVLAAADITATRTSSGGVVRVVMSDTNPDLLPSIAAIAKRLGSDTLADTAINRLTGDASISGTLLHASTPLHADDDEPSIIAAGRDITSGIKNFVFELAEQSRIAGRDIINTFFQIQHNRASDYSEIVAQRDILYPLLFDRTTGKLPAQDGSNKIAGPGRLDVIAGRDINLGVSSGFESIGNRENPGLADSGADMNFFAGINGPTAMSDPVLFNAFVAAYLGNIGGPGGSYIDWFQAGSYTGDAANLLSAFTGKSYATKTDVLTAYAALPVLTQQAIALEAYRDQRSAALAAATNKATYAAQKGFVDADDYSAALIDFISFDRFSGDLRSAVAAVTGQSYANNDQAATALALLPAAQQHAVAKTALTSAPITSARELITEIFFAEIRQGGIENSKGLTAEIGRDSFDRSYAAIARLFPDKAAGDQWQGDISLVFSALRSYGDGDINFFTPGGGVDVGLAGSFAGFEKKSGELGIITQRYGAINGFADKNIAINQSRIFSLDGAGVALWSTHGDIDAGRGAKTALTIPPPTIKQDPITGQITLEFPAAVSGSGIQSARNSRKTVLDRGALLTAADGSVVPYTDERTTRQRFYRSLQIADNYLFAPSGVVDAGDAGIAVEGNLLIAAQSVVGADNINVGGIAIGVPTTTSIAAGTLSLGDVASSATESATNSMNEAIRETAAALAESTAAFVTVDIIGVGR